MTMTTMRESTPSPLIAGTLQALFPGWEIKAWLKVGVADDGWPKHHSCSKGPWAVLIIREKEHGYRFRLFFKDSQVGQRTELAMHYCHTDSVTSTLNTLQGEVLDAARAAPRLGQLPSDDKVGRVLEALNNQPDLMGLVIEQAIGLNYVMLACPWDEANQRVSPKNRYPIASYSRHNEKVEYRIWPSGNTGSTEPEHGIYTIPQADLEGGMGDGPIQRHIDAQLREHGIVLLD